MRTDVALNNGVTMPVIGFGTSDIEKLAATVSM